VYERVVGSKHRDIDIGGHIAREACEEGFSCMTILVRLRQDDVYVTGTMVKDPSILCKTQHLLYIGPEIYGYMTQDLQDPARAMVMCIFSLSGFDHGHGMRHDARLCSAGML